MVTANRRRWTAEPEEEDEGDSGDGGRPEVRGSTRSFRARGRSFRVCQGGEGRSVAMAMANGGGGGSRVREREQGERRRARES